MLGARICTGHVETPLLKLITAHQFGRGSTQPTRAARRALEVSADVVPVPIRKATERIGNRQASRFGEAIRRLGIRQ